MNPTATDEEVAEIEALANTRGTLHWGGILRIINRMRAAEEALGTCRADCADAIEERARWKARAEKIRNDTLDEVANMLGYLPDAVRRIRSLKVKP